MSGLVKRIGTSIKWKITPVGKAGVVQCYVIQPVSDTSQYLAAHSLLASQPSLEHISSTDISDNFKWVINGAGIRNVASNKYLRFKVNADGTYDVELSSTESRWRVVKSETYDSRELKSDFTISSGTTFVTDNVDLSIAANPGNAFWVSKSDFTYTVKTQSDAGNVAVDNSKGTILANTEGETLILATHKVTGLTCEFKVSAEYRSVVVPVAYGIGSSYNKTVAFPVYLEYYLKDYSNLLSGATWKAYDNGVITFDSQNMTVTGKAPGYAWLEAVKNGKTVFICYVYTDNVFKDIDQISVRDYLYSSGTALGTMSCLTYEQDHKIDPLVLRVEWYLYAVKLLNQGKTDAEIRAELNRKFGLSFESDDMFQLFIAEVDHGSQGGYAREKIKMSLEGLRSLFNFYWMQYAMYSIANLDTVNVYTPATENDVRIENAYARQLLSGSRDKTHEILDRFTNNPNSTMTVLGTSTPEKTWYNVGEKLGARYFYSKDFDYYKNNYPVQTQAANNLFVQNCLNKGETIVFSHDPDVTLIFYADSSFAKGIRIIKGFYENRGYSVSFPQTTIGGIEVWTIKVS